MQEDLESSYEEISSLVKRLVRRYDSSSLEGWLLSGLRRAENWKENGLGHPWVYLLALKYFYFCRHSPAKSGRRLVGAREGAELISNIEALSGAVSEEEGFKPGNSSLLHRIVFQQYDYQQSPVGFESSRTIEILRGGKNFERWDSMMLNKTGCSLEELEDIGTCLNCLLSSGGNSWDEESFSQIKCDSFRSKIRQFCESVSFKGASVKRKLRTLLESPHTRFLRVGDPGEVFEISPLQWLPLYRRRSQRDGSFEYVSISKSLFRKRIAYHFYDQLRIFAPENVTLWGDDFERYVGRSLRYSGMQLLREAELKKLLKTDGMADFLAWDETVNIIFEAKAIDRHSSVAGGRGFSKKLRGVKEVVKSIDQATKTLSCLRDAKLGAFESISAPKNHLVIVTYKPLMLGNGKFLYEHFLREEIENILSGLPEEARISPECIHLLSIDRFDGFNDLVKVGTHSWFSRLGEIEDSLKKGGEGQKFDTSMYFGDATGCPDYLKESATGGTFERIIARMRGDFEEYQDTVKGRDSETS